MFDVVWDAPGERRYETGLDRGVLYPPGLRAVPWNGLTSVDEDVNNGSTETIYFDGVKRHIHVTPGDFSGTINALTYPDEFLKFDGYTQMEDVAGIFLDHQYRSSFGLSYRTYVGNDEDGLGHGYKIHLLYNLTAEPSSRKHQTISSSVEPEEFSWDVTGVPISPTNRNPTAHIIIDSRKSYPLTILLLEAILYGWNGVPGRLPTLEELEAFTTITVVDNGDGTATISGGSLYIYELPDTGYINLWEIDAVSLEYVSEEEVVISSS